jgi:maltose/moltooligosaccharide transporter
MAASLLWILDAANNVTMEPYRAFVSDKLLANQHSLGFLTQSAFTGLGQTLAYLTPSLLVWVGMNKDAVNAHHIPQVVIVAFLIGAVFSLASIIWTLKTSPEIIPDAAELAAMRARPSGIGATLRDIADAIRDMPATMRQLAVMKLFQWYAMFCYWQYITLALAHSIFGTNDQASAGFRDAGLLAGQLGAFYNLVSFISAFVLVRYARRHGAKTTHVVCLVAAGAGMLCIPAVHDPLLLFLPMIGIGLAWASIMGNPYIMLAGSIPAQRTGVYMGIFNMFIVIPMIVQIFTLPLYFDSWLGGSPENVIRLAGSLLVCAAMATCFVKIPRPRPEASELRAV